LRRYRQAPEILRAGRRYIVKLSLAFVWPFELGLKPMRPATRMLALGPIVGVRSSGPTLLPASERRFPLTARLDEIRVAYPSIQETVSFPVERTARDVESENKASATKRRRRS
jgi:hypothetical protein